MFEWLRKLFSRRRPGWLEPGERAMLRVPITSATALPGAKMIMRLQCGNCGRLFIRDLEPVEQIVAIDCACGAELRIEMNQPVIVKQRK